CYDLPQSLHSFPTRRSSDLKPSSPGNVVPVAELVDTPIYQSYIGSSAYPGFRDFAVTADIVKDKHIADGVSLDVNPTSRQMLVRSEEHTSELQSRFDIVCRL